MKGKQCATADLFNSSYALQQGYAKQCCMEQGRTLNAEVVQIAVPSKQDCSD